MTGSDGQQEREAERAVDERRLHSTLEVAAFGGETVRTGFGDRCVAVFSEARGGFVLTPAGARQLAALLTRHADACERSS